MVVIFDWPIVPLKKSSGKKRKKTGDNGADTSSVRQTEKEEERKDEIGFAAVTGRWSNDITVYKGGISEKKVAAVIKGANPLSNPHCEYAHSEVIYSLEVIARAPRLTLASASLDGTIRTWEPYSSRDVKNGYVLKKPRKGAGDWTCASKMETPRSAGSSVRPTKIMVLTENETMAVKCDDRVLIYCRGRYTLLGHEPLERSKQPPDERGRELSERFQAGSGPDWSDMATLWANPPGSSYSMCCLSVLSSSELAAGFEDGTIQIWTHDGSNNRHAWGSPLLNDQYNNPSGDPKIRCSNLTLKKHTGRVTGLHRLSLSMCDLLLSISDDKMVRVWLKSHPPSASIATGDAMAKRCPMWRPAMSIKGFQDTLGHVLTFPERQEFACHSGGFIKIWRIDQKDNSAKINVATVARLRTGHITCVAKLSSDALATGKANYLGSFGMGSQQQKVQIWRRGAEGGQWSASEKDSIEGLPNMVWRIFRVPAPTGDDKNLLRLVAHGGGGNGPSFDSTWHETKDGAWEKQK